MNHSKRLLRIAEKILADVHFSTQQEFDEYLKNHPNYRENTKFYVNGVQVKAPPKQKKNPFDPPSEEEEKIMKMSESQYPEIRREAAMLTDDNEIIERLSNDKDEIVRASLSYNPNTPKEIFEKLYKKGGKYVLGWMASSKHTPTEILEKLYDDSFDELKSKTLDGAGIRESLASNPNASYSMLEKLSKDTYDDVRNEAKKQLRKRTKK